MAGVPAFLLERQILRLQVTSGQMPWPLALAMWALPPPVGWQSCDRQHKLWDEQLGEGSAGRNSGYWI